MSKSSNYWFKRRRYGYGWIPVAWQGWVSVIVFVVVVVAAATYLLPEKPEAPSSLQLVTFLLVLLSAIFLLVGICLAKGPAPHWRWGKTEHDNVDEDY